jgi:hypothetical protein
MKRETYNPSHITHQARHEDRAAVATIYRVDNFISDCVDVEQW